MPESGGCQEVLQLFLRKDATAPPNFRLTDRKAQAVCYTCSDTSGGYQAKHRLSRLNAGYQAR